jgi:hypothetical protein
MVRLESACGRKKVVGLKRLPQFLKVTGTTIKIGWAIANLASRLFGLFLV